ncbi:huntingtin-interacting protein 1-like [Diorhabda sublineata]|uniref:huntingtin-interacting protein 1-like n=1 Tax=Diorhabda sublineata TaxID=1163346 RepID=UPI0024E0F9C4|nr:huntingtin-interacting protein 1-like [Diorhabda sublineata]
MDEIKTSEMEEEVIVSQESHNEEISIDTAEKTGILNPQSRENVVVLSAEDEMKKERKSLRSQVELLRREINDFMVNYVKEVTKLKDKVAELKIKLATKKSELAQERHSKENLFQQSFVMEQFEDSGQKDKNEKFLRIKQLYIKLRDEHIQKIREKAGIERKLVDALKNLHKLEMKNKKLQEDFEQKCVEISTLQQDKQLFMIETQMLDQILIEAYYERDEVRNDLTFMSLENEELKKTSEQMFYKILDLEHKLSEERNQSRNCLTNVVLKSLESLEDMMRHAIQEVDNPALTIVICSTDYFKRLSKGCISSLEYCSNIAEDDYASIITVANKITHKHVNYILQGKAVCNTSPDISFGEKVADMCKELGAIILNILEALKYNKNPKAIVKEAKEKIGELNASADNIDISILGEKEDTLVNMLESEMTEMDKAIEEAANRIQDMLTNSRATDSGIKLKVNEKILDSCTKLMRTIRILVNKSKLLQAEIVAQGRGTASANEFYKRNHQWTDGFTSAAKAVALAAKCLIVAIDEVVQSNGKLEQLVVAAHEIATTTAQLVVASRVKADRNSQNLQELTQASKNVSEATGAVLASVKDCSQLIDESEDMDVSNFTLYETKRLEMESQVQVLELEKKLEQERYRFSKLRKHHYQLTGESEI